MTARTDGEFGEGLKGPSNCWLPSSTPLLLRGSFSLFVCVLRFTPFIASSSESLLRRTDLRARLSRTSLGFTLMFFFFFFFSGPATAQVKTTRVTLGGGTRVGLPKRVSHLPSCGNKTQHILVRSATFAANNAPWKVGRKDIAPPPSYLSPTPGGLRRRLCPCGMTGQSQVH